MCLFLLICLITYLTSIDSWILFCTRYFSSSTVLLYFVIQIGHESSFSWLLYHTPMVGGTVYEGFWFIFLFFSLFLSSSSLITVGLFLLAFPYFLAVQDASGVQDAPSCLCPALALEPAISPRSPAPSPGEWY